MYKTDVEAQAGIVRELRDRILELKTENDELTQKVMAQDRLLHLADTIEERMSTYREARDKMRGRS